MKKQEKFVDFSEMMESYAAKLCTHVAKQKKKTKGENLKARCDLLAHQMEMWGENYAKQLIQLMNKTMMDMVNIANSPTHFEEFRVSLKKIVESTLSADHPSEKDVDGFIQKDLGQWILNVGTHDPATVQTSGAPAFGNLNAKQKAALRSQGVPIPGETGGEEDDDWLDEL